MEDKNVKKTTGNAYKQPDHIKPKSKWTKKTTIWVIVCAVIVLGILTIIGGENGWFKTKDMINGKVELDDYSTIEVTESSVAVSDDTIQNYLNSVVSAETTTEEVTEGTVENGDTINLDYSGVVEGEEEPFEGGTATGQTLTIGSGTMIDGFESSIEGHEVGETFDINVTFPEEYGSEDLAGKNAVFTITVNSKNVSNVPELTDELIQHYTEENYDEPINTIEEFKEYWQDRLYNNYLESAILSAMGEKTNVKYYNEADLANMTAYNQNYLSYYASMYGLGADDMASMFGYENAAAYGEGEAKELLKQTMMLDKVAEDQNITVTDEEMDEALTKYMESEAFEGTLEEFKAESGDAFLFLVRETEVLEPKVMEYLKQNVVIVEDPEVETEPAEEAAEDAADAVEDAVEEAAEDAADAVEEVADEAADAVEEVADEAADVVEDAKDAVEGAVEDVKDAAEDVVEDAKDAVEGAVEDVKDAAEDVVEDAKDAVEGAVEDVKDAAEDVVEDAAEAVEDAVDGK